MLNPAKPIRVGIDGVSYSLTPVPDLVRYDSKRLRELRAHTSVKPRSAPDRTESA